jgi:hypothetical protein
MFCLALDLKTAAFPAEPTRGGGQSGGVMDRWLEIVPFGIFFYLMMRFGCGRHMTHRDHDGKEKHKC